MAAIAVQKCLVNYGKPARKQITHLASAAYINKRHSSSNIVAFKKGPGGRSSFSGIVATVYGATGFLGRYVVNKLGRIGSQVIIPYRGEPIDYQYLRLTGELGQILFMPYDIRDEDSVKKAMKYSNVVINLTGRDFETKNFTFDDVHVKGARIIARAARESGIEKFIHFSSLNASSDPQKIYMKDGSQFLKTKYAGEQAVREEFPDAIIFRPSDMYGAEDRYLRYYANFWRRAHNTRIPLWQKGEATTKLPVYVADVAEGVKQAIYNPDAVGKTFETVGPHRYYLADLVDFFYNSMRFRQFRRIYLTPAFRLKAQLIGLIAPDPVCSLEKLEREHITDVLTDCPTLEDLGVVLTKLENRAPFDLKLFRQNAYYAEKLGEFPDPPAPPIVA